MFYNYVTRHLFMFFVLNEQTKKMFSISPKISIVLRLALFDAPY